MRKVIMILMVAALALPIMAQNFGEQEQPTATFQSTSTMTPSGSAYSATPALNADGTAYSPAAQTPTQTPNGPRKIGPTHGDGNPNPIGDAVLPLTLMALAYALVVYFRKRKQTSKG